jgi:4-diphosphocytidyl-2-C-methyl-D-erythritol kinase
MNHTQYIDMANNFCFVRAYAKINLTLDVLGRRTDGYHELATIMQTIDLYDTICLTRSNDEQIQLICSRPELSNDENLVVRAAQLVRERLGLRQGITIELDKHIPMAAGLGGGSSDGAAVLVALQRWWQLPLSSDELLAMAAALGSDIPFFLTGGLALCEGRGERVTPLPLCWPAELRWLILLKPAISISTATVFRDLSAQAYTDGSHSLAVREALQAKRMPQKADLHNSLEQSVLKRYPEVVQAREAMLNAGATFVRLSGSGPTLFAPFADLQQAMHTLHGLHKQGYEVYLTRPVKLSH